MMVWEKARRDAADLLEQLWDGHLPVDPFEFASALGIRVTHVALGEGFAGEIVARPGERARIRISVSDVPARQAFTCAHELGHYIERSEARDDDYVFTEYVNLPRKNSWDDSPYPRHEFYADEFAGSLLMPEDQFIDDMDAGLSNLELARKYDVSIAAAKKRRERILKYRDHE